MDKNGVVWNGGAVLSFFNCELTENKNGAGTARSALNTRTVVIPTQLQLATSHCACATEFTFAVTESEVCCLGRLMQAPLMYLDANNDGVNYSRHTALERSPSFSVVLTT